MLDMMGLTVRKRSRDHTVLTMSEFGRLLPGTLRRYRWRVVAISLDHFVFQRDDAMQKKGEILKPTGHYCTTHEI